MTVNIGSCIEHINTQRAKNIHVKQTVVLPIIVGETGVMPIFSGGTGSGSLLRRLIDLKRTCAEKIKRATVFKGIFSENHNKDTSASITNLILNTRYILETKVCEIVRLVHGYSSKLFVITQMDNVEQKNNIEKSFMLSYLLMSLHVTKTKYIPSCHNSAYECSISTTIHNEKRLSGFTWYKEIIKNNNSNQLQKRMETWQKIRKEGVMKKKYNERNIFRVLRMIRDIKVTDLAKTLDVSPANISSIEAGRHNPGKRLLKDYAHALGVTPDFISNHISYDNSTENSNENRYEEYLFSILNEVLTLDREGKYLIM